jgi:AcrR family transcriptional regulator
VIDTADSTAEDPPARRTRGPQLLNAICDHAMQHGLAALSLRPVAHAVGSSTGVLRFLFGSKEKLIARLLDLLLTRDRAMLGHDQGCPDDVDDLNQLWRRVRSPQRRHQMLLSFEGQIYSLRRPGRVPYAEAHFRAWLAAAARAAPAACRDPESIQATLIVAMLRGALLDLLATGDSDRVHAAVTLYIRSLETASATRTTLRGRR